MRLKELNDDDIRANLKDPKFWGRAPLVVGWTAARLRAAGHSFPPELEEAFDAVWKENEEPRTAVNGSYADFFVDRLLPFARSKNLSFLDCLINDFRFL